MSRGCRGAAAAEARSAPGALFPTPPDVRFLVLAFLPDVCRSVLSGSRYLLLQQRALRTRIVPVLRKSTASLPLAGTLQGHTDTPTKHKGNKGASATRDPAGTAGSAGCTGRGGVAGGCGGISSSSSETSRSQPCTHAETFA